MISATLEPSAFAYESAPCSRCGGLLGRNSFVTDYLGRTVERCQKCGPQLMAVHVGAPIASGRRAARNVFIVKPENRHLIVLPPCACGSALKWLGRGRKPSACRRCRASERRARQRLFWATHNEYCTARTRARRAAIRADKVGLACPLE